MRSQLNCSEVVYLVDAVVDLDLSVDIQKTSIADLRPRVMEYAFEWGGWQGDGGVQTHYCSKPNLTELR